MKRAVDISELQTDGANLISAGLRLMDERLPRWITGLYLLGTVALGGYLPGRSDVDFVAVTESALTPLDLEQLGQLHNHLRRTAPHPKLDGAYVTWLELSADPAGLSAPYCLDFRFASGGGLEAYPVTWVVMHRSPVVPRSPAI